MDEVQLREQVRSHVKHGNEGTKKASRSSQRARMRTPIAAIVPVGGVIWSRLSRRWRP